LTQALPLAGIRVVDYTHFLAGPYLSRCLAAMDAEVIKVERPTTGDAGRQHACFIGWQRDYFMQQNMGKQGLCINLKDARGLELLHKLTDSTAQIDALVRDGVLYAEAAVSALQVT
jgi:crotonobetainyl-CoA:carnitine CoA-transferase CaiB-like acyl-CoA transferase